MQTDHYVKRLSKAIARSATTVQTNTMRHPASTGIYSYSQYYRNANKLNSLVCKHWMRALCKKGDACEFLHEYNLRRMPECKNYNYEHNTCPNGDDCMYQHLTPEAKLPPCPSYDRGFCPLGPICARRHVRKEKLCPFYVAGFCPDGKECQEGAHARFPVNLPKPDVKGTVDLMGEQEKPQSQYQQTHMGGMDDESGMAMGFRAEDGEDRPRDFGGRGRGGWPMRAKRGRGRGRGRGG
jgi:cleavage and polyadenylation specificity factor subunit 4